MHKDQFIRSNGEWRMAETKLTNRDVLQLYASVGTVPIKSLSLKVCELCGAKACGLATLRSDCRNDITDFSKLSINCCNKVPCVLSAHKSINKHFQDYSFLFFYDGSYGPSGSYGSSAFVIPVKNAAGTKTLVKSQLVFIFKKIPTSNDYYAGVRYTTDAGRWNAIKKLSRLLKYNMFQMDRLTSLDPKQPAFFDSRITDKLVFEWNSIWYFEFVKTTVRSQC